MISKISQTWFRNIEGLYSKNLTSLGENCPVTLTLGKLIDSLCEDNLDFGFSEDEGVLVVLESFN